MQSISELFNVLKHIKFDFKARAIKKVEIQLSKGDGIV